MYDYIFKSSSLLEVYQVFWWNKQSIVSTEIWNFMIPGAGILVWGTWPYCKCGISNITKVKYIKQANIANLVLQILCPWGWVLVLSRVNMGTYCEKPINCLIYHSPKAEWSLTCCGRKLSPCVCSTLTGMYRNEQHGWLSACRWTTLFYVFSILSYILAFTGKW